MHAGLWMAAVGGDAFDHGLQQGGHPALAVGANRPGLHPDGRLLFSGTPREIAAPLVGRSFQLREPGDNRRELLTRALKRPEVTDSSIQDHSLWLILGKASKLFPPTEIQAAVASVLP